MSKANEVFSANDRVKNPVYGSGTISHVDTQYTLINFDDHGAKKFLTKMVKLEHTSIPAPEKPARAAKAKASKAAKATKADKVPKVAKAPKPAKSAKAAKKAK